MRIWTAPVTTLLLLLALGCTKSGPRTATEPTTSPTISTFGKWSGTVGFVSAAPAGSCEVAYVASHPQLFAQTASADLQIHGDTAAMTVQTASGQRCGFLGRATNGDLGLVTRHEDCEGYPLATEALLGIAQSCHKIDLAGDGPYWGGGTLTARITDSEMEGNWTSQVWDPGGGSYGSTNVIIELHVHLSRQ